MRRTPASTPTWQPSTPHWGWLVLLLPIACFGLPVLLAAGLAAGAGAVVGGTIGTAVLIASVVTAVVVVRRRRTAACTPPSKADN